MAYLNIYISVYLYIIDIYLNLIKNIYNLAKVRGSLSIFFICLSLILDTDHHGKSSTEPNLLYIVSLPVDHSLESR